MTTILHIAASPRGAASQSAKLAETYLDARRAAEPGVGIDRLDLWQAELPEFDGDKAAAKMTFFGQGEMDGPRRSAWDQITAIAGRFIEADEYVLSVPMWNGGIPYKLKQYIDIITQPGLLFGFDPENGYRGLLEGRTARVFYTAGVYSPGAPARYGADHHSTYLGWWLDFIGVAQVETVRLQPSLMTADPAGDQARALARAAELPLQMA
ncbi:FMN-dependent NADH-azoreductase [Mangrovicoccus sp. HB161399]|uniref:FMN-dependent NADH-azoreductase n=1 Tax=Mangrovicoccus sp. HB161399 TaxID=2720392 RepID=UPI0015570E4F|nr:NAD(P)H-dependent oxidoreductase [Mangrovicoccus sp. HB161399]